MEKYKLEVVLVNLISLDYLVRYQAPLPVNTLAGYLNTHITNARISVIDMQEIFSELNLTEKDEKESLSKSIAFVINEIKLLSKNMPVVLGLSMKWTTQNIASAIINGISSFNDNNILVIIGNIMATYGHKQLLRSSEFHNALAVIGEGEDALVSIVNMALNNPKNEANLSLYSNIDNVAINANDIISVKTLKRMDLESYPSLTIRKSSDILDKEWQVHAIETSRGCPWGVCSFCSIKKQFGDRCSNSKQTSDWGWKGFSLDKIFIDIQNYIEQGARMFDIKDSEFFGPMRVNKGFDPFWDSMSRAEDFAIRFGELNRKYGIMLNHISVRVDTVVRENDPLKNIRRKQVYELLAKSGLIGLYLGVESGSNRQLKRFGKGVTVEENKKAIEILTKIGLKLEVGFIFFDPLANMDDLYSNINFINETNLYKTDSRIFGSLRVQEGTAYVKLLQKKGLLREYNAESLSYSCEYQNKDVLFIKNIFEKWELATIKLVRLLSTSARLKYYEINFTFLQSILNHYFISGQSGIKEVVAENAKRRREFLNEIWNNGGLLNSYLIQAKKMNNALI